MASRSYSPRRTYRSIRPLCPVAKPGPGGLIVPPKKKLITPPAPRIIPAGGLFGLTKDPQLTNSHVVGNPKEGLRVVPSVKEIHALAGGGGDVRIQTSVSYEEYVGSPTFQGNGQELSAQSTWRVRWSDIETLYLILFPGPLGVIPQLPMLMPNSLVLRAQDVRFEPEFDEALIVSNDGNNHYDHAKATIQWRTTPFSQSNPNTDQILTRRISVSGEFLTIPGWGCEWDGSDDESSSGPAGAAGGSAVNEDVQAGRVLPIIEHHLTLHRVPSVPYALMRSLVGHVNSVEFEGAEPETVMFAGAEIQQTVTSDGSQPWQIEMHFEEKIIRQDGEALGWNYAFDTKTGRWRRIMQGNGDPIYPLGDLNDFI